VLKWVVMFSIDLCFLLWVPVMAEWLGVLVLVGHFRLADLVLVCVSAVAMGIELGVVDLSFGYY